MKQNKKVVWITGASSGIGKELCYKFSQENWDIALTARRQDKLLKITKEIGSNNTICTANVADKSEVEQAFNKLLKSHNKIDLAILNAGIYRSVSFKNFNSTIFKPKMIKQGYGHIAILTSPTGWRGLPKAAAYGPTKSALKNLAESLKFELEPLGIKIQLFCPGFVETEATPVGEHSLPGIISARKAANLIFNSLKSNYFEVFIPNNFVIWSLYILKFLPENLAHRLIKWRTGY